MRLIECNLFTTTGVRTSTVDLDKIDFIMRSDTGQAMIMLIERDVELLSDMPYERAVALWENYQPQKGVTAKFD